MVIRSIDESDVRGCVLKRLGCRKAAKTTTDDDDVRYSIAHLVRLPYFEFVSICA